jgi:hypothetical protein
VFSTSADTKTKAQNSIGMDSALRLLLTQLDADIDKV